MVSTVLSGPFGSERFPVPETPEPGVVTPQARPDGAPIQPAPVIEAGVPALQAGAQARLERSMEPDSSMLEGVGAAIHLWDTSRLVQRLGRPSFEDDVPINQNEALDNVPMVLDKDERDYVLEVGKGQKSFQYAIEQIQGRRQAAKVLGDHPVVGLATSFMDPLWLAVPPAVRIGKASPAAGRAVSAALGAGVAGAVGVAGEGPVNDKEIALSMLMNGAAAAVLYKPGQGLVKADKDFPDKALNEAITPSEKPRYKLVDGKPELVPQELAPNAVRTEAAQVVQAVDTAIGQDAASRGLGSKLMWNMHKTMSSYGDVGKRVADLLYDNNADLSLTSVEAHREMILSALRTPQIQYEDLLRAQMAVEGAGLGKMVNPLTSREAYGVQQRIEKAVQTELFRREQMARTGATVGVEPPPHIKAMADKLDELHKIALKEMQQAGVAGAENLLERPGYLNRKWSSLAMDQVMDRMEALGISRDVARSKLDNLVSLSLRRASPGMDKELSDVIGRAITKRALDKGYFEDTAFNANVSGATAAEIRSILKGSGADADTIERAITVLTNKVDEQGKQAFLKHRMDLDYTAQMLIGNETFSVMDLIDSRVSTIVDQYVQRASTTSALARNGLGTASDVVALRRELLASISDVGQREKAKELFDNTMAHLRGDPAGAKVNENFRLIQAYTRSISLAWSGLWQATEYANAMGEFGLLKTLKYMTQELPGFRSILRPDAHDARTLDNVLAEHSTSSLRLRPFLAKFEDGYEMDMGSAMQLSMQTANQMVPYANAMRYVHHHQAKVVGNLILDRLDKAASGNQKAREALAKYGIEAPVMDKLAAEIQKHGFNVDDWNSAVWAQVRPAFGKMMDASVLRSRLGDVPAFAAFDTVGKFLFTYRTFVLTAHNKVLAGGMERNGAAAVGMVLMYQWPLAMAAVQAQSVIKGDGTLKDGDLVKKSLGQMGGLGLFSEPLKWATGESNSIGAPGLIAVDRGVKLFQAGTNLDPKAGASAALSLAPVVIAVPFINGMAKQIKEKD